MRTRKLTLRLIVSALTCAGLSLAGNPALAAEYWLKADVATITVAGTSVPMWGYALCGMGSVPTGWPDSCNGAVSIPGPALIVPPGDATGLTVHLKNNLTVPTSLVINGLVKPMAPVWAEPGSTTAMAGRGTSATARVRSFDTEAGPNLTADYTWSNVRPGTYLYQSGTQPQVQVQMGLYGMLSRNERDADATNRARAYADDAYQYDNQAALLYSEIDPAMHEAISVGSYGTAPTSTINYAPKYFLINGTAYPERPTIAPSGLGGTTLLRLLNAGLMTHVPMIMGRHWDVIAEDGKPYAYLDAGVARPNLRSQYTALLPAAKTLDVLVQHQPGAGSYAVMDRRLSLSNNGADGVGGMLAFVLPGPGTGGSVAGSGTGTNGVNQPPLAANDPADTAAPYYETVAGVKLNIAAPGVLVNDSDPNPSQAITAVTASNMPTTAGAGTYTLNANGSFALTPTAAGTYVFEYKAKDPYGVLSNAATVTVTVVDPVVPTLAATPLDVFDIPDGPLGSNWAYTNDGTKYVGVVGSQAAAAGAGGLAIWQAETFGATQYAAFTGGTSLAGASLILKATGGTNSQPNGYIEVRHSGSDVRLFTVGSIGSGGYTETLQATFTGVSGAGQLSARVDYKGLVTVFQNGSFVGGHQLPSWMAGGKIGIKLGTGAAVDDFVGGTL